MCRTVIRDILKNVYFVIYSKEWDVVWSFFISNTHTHEQNNTPDLKMEPKWGKKKKTTNLMQPLSPPKSFVFISIKRNDNSYFIDNHILSWDCDARLEGTWLPIKLVKWLWRYVVVWALIVHMYFVHHVCVCVSVMCMHIMVSRHTKRPSTNRILISQNKIGLIIVFNVVVKIKDDLIYGAKIASAWHRCW